MFEFFVLICKQKEILRLNFPFISGIVAALMDAYVFHYWCAEEKYC